MVEKIEAPDDATVAFTLNATVADVGSFVPSDLFLAHGYAATTIASVSTEAGVSVETVYKAFGGKPQRLRSVKADAHFEAAAH